MSGSVIRTEDEAGAQQLVGYRVAIHPDHVEVSLTVGEEHISRNASLHGGLAVMILDAALGYACSRSLAEDASIKIVTVALTTNFIASPRLGDTVTASARVVGGGRKTLFAEGRIIDDDGTLIATASGVFRRRSDRPAGPA